jgi:hypothetical protein
LCGRFIEREGSRMIAEVLEPVAVNLAAQERVECPSRLSRGILIASALSVAVWAALIWAVTIVV